MVLALALFQTATTYHSTRLLTPLTQNTNLAYSAINFLLFRRRFNIYSSYSFKDREKPLLSSFKGHKLVKS